jgi:hypothetical protein
MRKNVLARAPRRARTGSLYGTPRGETPERHAGTHIPGGHHAALGKSALQNTLNVVGSWVDTLKVTSASVWLAAASRFGRMRETSRTERGGKEGP